MRVNEADHHPWHLRVTYPILRWIVWLLMLFLAAPMRGVHRGRVPRKGPLLVFSNHISNSDPVLVQWSCPRLIHFMARRDLFTMGGLGSILRWWHAFPVTQSSADTGAIKHAIKLLQAGKVVCIFPEGQLSPHGELAALHSGAALVVRQTGVPCICVGLRNSNVFMPNPETKPRWTGKVLSGTWGNIRQFDRKTDPAEIMDWIESELRSLSGQPPKETAGPTGPAVS